MNKLVLALLLASTSLVAATFEERIDNANAAFETEQGEAYDKSLRPYMQAAIKKCAPGGSAPVENPGKFVLVADVSPEGKLSNPVVKPETKSSICFSNEFSALALPAPPASLLANGFAPLVVEIYIVR